MIKQACATLAWLTLGGLSIAAECPLERGIYTEATSGAVLAFHPKTAEYGIMTSGVFDLTLPNLDHGYPGEITWTAGRNSRPYGFIEQACQDQADSEEIEACRIWTGNVYAVGDGTVAMIEDDEMIAPQAMLFADFGHAILWHQAFLAANPRARVMDLFTLNGCAP